jgi:uncharacterized protein
MARIIFPNLPVSDLERSKAFYTGLGFTLNEQFTNDDAAAVVISDEIVVMLLSPGFAEQAGVPLTGTPSQTLALSLDSREEVDTLIEKAVAGGGLLKRETDEEGFMYSRGIDDPDGHVWDFLWMDPRALEG